MPRFLFTRPRRHLPALLLVLLLGVSLAACHETPDVPPTPTDAEVGRDFLPVAVGNFWVYDVTEVKWDSNDSTVEHYQMRERVDTVYQGATGETNYRIVRARRADTATPWRDDTAFALVLTPQLVRRTFANLPTVELIFPVREGRTWNPNLFNALDSTDRTYEALDQPRTLPNGQTYARTVRVFDLGEDNLYYLRQTASTYARGVGRISYVARTLDFCQLTDSLNVGCATGPGYIVRGREREEYLREHSLY